MRSRTNWNILQHKPSGKPTMRCVVCCMPVGNRRSTYPRYSVASWIWHLCVSCWCILESRLDPLTENMNSALAGSMRSLIGFERILCVFGGSKSSGRFSNSIRFTVLRILIQCQTIVHRAFSITFLVLPVSSWKVFDDAFGVSFGVSRAKLQFRLPSLARDPAPFLNRSVRNWV